MFWCIHDDLFYIIHPTHQDKNIMWKFISNKQNKNGSQSEATEIRDDNIQNKKRIITKKPTNYNLQRNRQKN